MHKAMSKPKISVIPPRPDWAAQGQDWTVAVAQALGDEALRVDHVGSTAVPGLPAKDVIDIQATVMRLDDIEGLSARMQAAGFRRRPERERDGAYDGVEAAEAGRGAEDWRKLFFREPARERRVHIHVRRNGAANNRLALLLRDFLRADAAARDSYAAFKLALWQATETRPEAYARIKAPYIAMTLRAADGWAELTRWTPGAPDAYWRSAQ